MRPQTPDCAVAIATVRAAAVAAERTAAVAAERTAAVAAASPTLPLVLLFTV